MTDLSTIIPCAVCGTRNRVRLDRLEEGPRCGRCGHPITVGHAGGGSPVEVTDSTFQSEVLQSPGPVLVDFWAPWCGPCRAVAPVLESLASRYAGKLKIAKVNTDDNPLVAGRLGIQSIPTLVLYRDGAVVDRATGALPGSQMEAWLRRHGAV